MRKELKNNILRCLMAVVILLAIDPAMLYSQVTNVGNNSTLNSIYNKGETINSMGMTQEELAAQEGDSIKGKKDDEEKERKPLLSYYFSDSTKNQKYFAWSHNPINNNIEIEKIDTLLADFQKDYLFLHNSNVGAAYIGALGAGAVQLDYFSRPDNQSFTFLDAFNDYLYRPDNVPYYNVRNPYTELAFFTSGQTTRAEEQLRVIHAQSISPSSGFNMTYRNNATRGMYNSQASKDKNLSLAFDHTGKRYSIHAGYIYNMGELTENGGITDYFYVRDTLIDLAENIPVNMKGTTNNFKQNTFYVTQSYGMPFRKLLEGEAEDLRNKSAIFFGHSFELSTAKNVYSDDASTIEEGYYTDWNIHPTISSDSIREQRLDTKLFMQLQPYSRDGILALLGGGIGYQRESYYYFKPNDYIFKGENTNESSVYIYGNAEGKLRKYLNWNGEFKYTPIGYRSQDMQIKGNLDMSAYLRDRPISLSAGVLYSMESPSYWTEHYYSNHFTWDNSFSKEIETRFEAALSIPQFGIEVGGKQSVIDNKIYYDESALPAQYDGILSMSAIYLQKDFRLGGLNLKNRVLLQWSSSQKVAPVPLASANAIYYYEFDVKKDVLTLQLGLEGYYNTSYYGFGYNPATMQFYNQRTTETGNYIWADAFLTGKWKRLRFLVKFQHVNYELFGDRNYFQIANYPLNRRMMKLGVSWAFYD